MSIASIALPRRMLVGGGAIQQCAGLLKSFGLSKPLIISDPFLGSSASGAVDSVSKALAAGEMKHDIFLDTIPDPTSDAVEKCRAALEKGSYDSIVAVGGGSPMDTAKAAATLIAHGGKMRDYKAPFQMDKEAIPIIAVPTTSGTGSEATKFTIITDSESGEKMLCIGLAYLPLAAVLDYELTMSMPFRLTADTGIDAMCHAMEAYVSAKKNPFSQSLALAAMTKISQNLRTACNEPDNKHAREMMMLGSCEAGMAFSNASVTLIHGMSRPFGAQFHVPHGLSNAMLAPKVTAFGVQGAVKEYAEVARCMGMYEEGADDAQAAAEFPSYLQKLNDDLKVPTMSEYGIDSTQFHDQISWMSEAALASGSPNNNPVIPTHPEIEDLYRQIYQ